MKYDFDLIMKAVDSTKKRCPKRKRIWREGHNEIEAQLEWKAHRSRIDDMQGKAY